MQENTIILLRGKVLIKKQKIFAVLHVQRIHGYAKRDKTQQR